MSKYYSTNVAFGASSVKTEQIAVSTTKVGTVTTEASSGALTVDEVPTLDSLNPVSSDGVARAVIQAGAELPTRGDDDTGKVLTVKNSAGDLEWDEPVEELPSMEGKNGKLLGAVDNNGTMEARWVNPPDSYPSIADNAGKVLTVNSGATGVEWADAASGIPEAAAADEGKVLGVTDNQGTVGWVAQTPAQVNSDWNASSGVAQILNKPSLATVATSGSYSDLTNKPTIPDAQVNSDWNASSGVSEILHKPDLSVYAQSANLAAVATSGSYNDLQDKPTIPSAYSAGTGIDITSNVISADIDNSTIKTALAPSTIQEAGSLIRLASGYGAFEINSSVKAKLTQDSSASGSKLKIHIPGNVFSFSGDVTSGQDASVYVELCSDQYFNAGSTTALFPVALTNTYNSQRGKTLIDEQDIEISGYMADWLSESSGTTLVPSTLNPATSSSSSHWYMGFFRGNGTHTSNQAYAASSASLPPDYRVVISEYVQGNKLCVANPVPAFASLDNGKVLGVVNGALAWVSLT